MAGRRRHPRKRPVKNTSQSAIILLALLSDLPDAFAIQKTEKERR